MSEFTMSILSIAGVGFSALGAYGISLFVDKFCSVKVDEAIIRRIEQLNQGTPNKIPTILSEMTVEERARVLERVLDFRPWSKELSAQVRLERQKKEENEAIVKMEEQALVDLKKNDSDRATHCEDESDGEREKPEIVNILTKVWSEFGNKGNGNKGGLRKEKDEVTETCAICMEDYEEHDDVIIGANCVHMYHKDCLMKWMLGKHDFCPYCREYSFEVSDFIDIAKKQLDEDRFKELVEKDDPDLVSMYIGSSTSSPNSSEDSVIEDQAS